MNIELREIPGEWFSDYRAGSDGFVYSLKYGSPRRMRGGKTSKGYFIISTSNNDQHRCFSTHSIICAAYHGERPGPKMEVRHLDGNPGNNKPDNLKWGTPEENWDDRKRHGHGMRGSAHPRSKMSDDMRAEIVAKISSGELTFVAAAKLAGVQPCSVREMYLRRCGNQNPTPKKHSESNEDFQMNFTPSRQSTRQKTH